jgi:hypothetical protein
MNALTTMSRDLQTISSLEIAELTGKTHNMVMRDVRKMLGALDIQPEQFCSGYVDAKGETRACYELPAREVKILITGYDVVRRAKVIDRLEALEKIVAGPVLPAAAVELQEFMAIGQVLGVPIHITQVEGVKMLKATTGKDYMALLQHTPSQNNIAYEEMMLEPTEIGKRHGLSGRAVNNLLADLGYQVKINGDWVPTEQARGKASQHHWERAGKTGYNLKWNVALVESLFEAEAA